MLLPEAKGYVSVDDKACGGSGVMGKNEPAPHGAVAVRALVVRDGFYAMYPQVSHGFFDRFEGHEARLTLGSAENDHVNPKTEQRDRHTEHNETTDHVSSPPKGSTAISKMLQSFPRLGTVEERVPTAYHCSHRLGTTSFTSLSLRPALFELRGGL
jgi:hypothetical protein